jgi:hypothetical protein
MTKVAVEVDPQTFLAAIIFHAGPAGTDHVNAKLTGRTGVGKPEVIALLRKTADQYEQDLIDGKG